MADIPTYDGTPIVYDDSHKGPRYYWINQEAAEYAQRRMEEDPNLGVLCALMEWCRLHGDD